MSEQPPLVLVVEDEPDLADLYAAWLGDEYRVRTAYGGREALDQLDEADDEVDAILLDRRMPGLSGDEVLTAVRDRGIDCRVAMVTAVEPDFDILEMGFDDYLVKPVTSDTLRETVEGLLRRGEYDTEVQELFSLTSKKAMLESEKSASDLADNEEYQRLTERIAELRERADESRDAVATDDEDYEKLFQDFDTDGYPATEPGEGNAADSLSPIEPKPCLHARPGPAAVSARRRPLRRARRARAVPAAARGGRGGRLRGRRRRRGRADRVGQDVYRPDRAADGGRPRAVRLPAPRARPREVRDVRGAARRRRGHLHRRLRRHGRGARWQRRGGRHEREGRLGDPERRLVGRRARLRRRRRGPPARREAARADARSDAGDAPPPEPRASDGGAVGDRRQPRRDRGLARRRTRRVGVATGRTPDRRRGRRRSRVRRRNEPLRRRRLHR
ncbi:response regulator receiver protein [Halorubrum distributum JCM 9100]|uniref:Response regulator receiver protein n=6 Tax=Halorubrum distributum TaxID=29283 RepID=M0EWA3_9EURY|nr:response regulator receiver protein [Halorubrum distributum JCM 9100]